LTASQPAPTRAPFDFSTCRRARKYATASR
jgi:hypothetical protein